MPRRLHAKLGTFLNTTKYSNSERDPSQFYVSRDLEHNSTDMKLQAIAIHVTLTPQIFERVFGMQLSQTNDN